MHATLTLRATDLYKYNPHKIARQLGDRLGPFIGGEAYDNRHRLLYRFEYTTTILAYDNADLGTPQEGIVIIPISQGVDYVKYTLTLKPIPITG